MAAAQHGAGVKPALKHGDEGSAQGKSKKARVGGIQWDEPTIAEHDKDRGTRMKIEEPDTPFNHSMPADGDDVPPEILLADAASAQATHQNSRSSTLRGGEDIKSTDWAADAASVASDAELAALGDSDQDDAAEPADGGGTFVGGPVDVAHVKEFSKVRSQHYNEFQQMKEMRAQGLLDEDDEEEQEETKIQDSKQ